jgi:phage repressor protein C with HTH and peptisase S24 domain
MLIDDQLSGNHIPVLRRLVSSYTISSLKAVEVRGDSMTEVRMFDGDIVVFAAGYISSEGIYVLSVNGDVLIKRVEFDSFDKTIKVSSENPQIP